MKSNSKVWIVLTFVLIVFALFILQRQLVNSQPTYLTHGEMHELMQTMLGDHFEEKHHTQLHEYLEKEGELSRDLAHEPMMHNFMKKWMSGHFEEKHHEQLHKFLISKETTQNEMMSQPSFLPGKSLDINTLEKAKSSTILDLLDGDVVELSADIIVKEIKGKEYKMYGYNGQIPGPVFRIKQESTVTVNFKNNIDWNTTIHWHGLRHDNKDDGVPDVTQPPIKPGETFVYTVYFPDEGIYWYHPHVREDIQQDNGLAGNMLVVPLSENYYNPVNKEELVVLDDVLIENDEIVPFGKEHANFVLMGRFGNTMLINGEEEYLLNVNKGDVVRFYITNVANARPFNLSFSGARMKLIGSDLGKYEKEEFVDSVVISPAERYIVEVLFEEERSYTIVHANPSKSYKLGVILVDGKDTDEDYSSTFFELRSNDEIVEDIDMFREYFDKPVDYEIKLDVDMPEDMMIDMIMESGDMPCHEMSDGTMMGNCDGVDEEEEKETIEWEDDMKMMNTMSTSEMVTWIMKDKKTEKENMDFEMKAKVGDKVKIRLFNDPDSIHPMQHPIHLHGQRFLVLSVDGSPNSNLVWKDTVLVPIGSEVDILVDVTNPGEWMMHCHIAEHLEAGMMSSFVVI